MTNLILIVGVLLFLLMFVVLHRTILGPTTLDRLICVNMLGTKTIILLIMIGFIYGKVDFLVDLALTYAFLGFLASIVVTRYVKHCKRVPLAPNKLE